MLRNSSFLSFSAVTSLLIFSLLQHIFRSAYKIVFKRAIHHRTMLISSRLDHLGGVWNLEQFAATIAGTHERFSSAVVQEFTKYYQIDIHFGGCLSVWVNLTCFKCCVVMDLGGARDIEYIRKGISELSVINYFMLSTAINLNDCNRVWIDKPQKIIYTPCSTLSRGECHKSSLIFSSPVRHVFLPLIISRQKVEIRSKMLLFGLFSSVNEHVHHQYHVRIA